MNNIFYAFKQVFRLRWLNLIKIVSLALGICVSAVLMCMVAWERSFDNFWAQPENLLYMEMNYICANDPDMDGTDDKCPPGLAPEIAQNIPSVEAATRFRFAIPFNYLIDDKPFSLMTYFADTSFFDVLQIKILDGEDPKEILKTPGKVIISQKTATLLFSDKDPLGKQIRDNENVYTVCGISQDLPKNSYLDNPQIIIGTDIPVFLDGNTAWFTLLRTCNKTNIKNLNTRINTHLEPLFRDWEGTNITFHVNQLHNYGKQYNTGRHAIFSILTFALLLISGLNFALLSISSLTSRAKEVGVRKAAGARISGIFSLIIFETIIYVLSAAILSVIILWGVEPQLEHITGNYEDIFAFANLWAAGLVLVVLVLIAGVIPAWIFSRIPVTQVFKRFTSNNLLGKRILLFIQFTASVFVFCFMFIILHQYQISIRRDLGYDKEKLICVNVYNTTETQKQAIIAEISSDSRVEAVTLSSGVLYSGFSGIAVSMEAGNHEPLYARWIGADSLFFKTHSIPILLGSTHLTATYDDAGNVIVNQALIEKLNITGNPIGQVFYKQYAPATIVGVCGNFESVWGGLQPIVITANHSLLANILTVRVNDVNKDMMETIKGKMEPFYQNSVPPELSIYSENIFKELGGVRMFRDLLIMASICLLLITIMGILGYVNMETRRRTKEIAIRKIHGSTTLEIIWKIFRGLLLISLLSAAVAIPLAYIIGSYWQQEFPQKGELSWILFAGATIIVVLTIAICTVLQTWRSANANLARTIKSE